MKICVLANLYGDLSLEATLEKLRGMGVEAVEIGSGGYPGTAHCNPSELLEDEGKLREWRGLFDKYGIELAALSCHGNGVHPNVSAAAAAETDFRKTVELAEKVGVDTVVTFSGCPGGSPSDRQPNWVTCAWPPEYLEVLDYQWNEVLIPYWKEAGAYAKRHGVKHIALEMHPGFCVYNTETLLKLRSAVGESIGANLDPSHLVWQGIDPVEAIKVLGSEGAIYHFHAKDVRVDPRNVSVNGVLDTKHYTDELHRSWIFRALGYGHSVSYWRDIASALQLVGYDRVMSIEHEDSLMSVDEGLAKAVGVLKEAIISSPKPSTISWA